MCLHLFKKRNAFEKNAKKYVKDKFEFLTSAGYKYKYYFLNGEEEHTFCNDKISIQIYYVTSTFAFDISVYDSKFPYSKGKNIKEIIQVSEEKLKLFSPIETIDYYSELLKQNLDKIEKSMN